MFTTTQRSASCHVWLKKWHSWEPAAMVMALNPTIWDGSRAHTHTQTEWFRLPNRIGMPISVGHTSTRHVRYCPTLTFSSMVLWKFQATQIIHTVSSALLGSLRGPWAAPIWWPHTDISAGLAREKWRMRKWSSPAWSYTIWGWSMQEDTSNNIFIFCKKRAHLPRICGSIPREWWNHHKLATIIWAIYIHNIAEPWKAGYFKDPHPLSRSNPDRIQI